MRTLVLIIIFQLLLGEAIGQSKGDETLVVDTQRSKLEWTGKKLGGEHYGEIFLSGGQLIFKKGKLVGGSFEIDMTSINCLDITDPKSNKRLVDHLKSEDFFSAVRFPKSTFKIAKVQSKSQNEYIITGDLTIKDKTNSLEFPASIKDLGGERQADANLVFDRSQFDVKFGSQTFFENIGDKVVYDDIELKVRLFLLPKETQ